MKDIKFSLHAFFTPVASCTDSFAKHKEEVRDGYHNDAYEGKYTNAPIDTKIICIMLREYVI